MRNRNKINQLGRTASHRNALMMNLANALITHKRISTTLAKAKALRGYVEPLITKSKDDTTHSRRLVFRHLQNKEAVAELFREVGPKVADRPGGYTRIIKTGFRSGDSAEMCMIELVDFNEVYTSDSKESAAKKTRRSRRGSGGGAKAASPAAEAKTDAKAAIVEDAVVESVEEKKAEAPVEEAAAPVAEEAAEVETPAEDESSAADSANKAEDESAESDDDKKEASN
ncbi:MAG: 50S ribosomal protein L17 [Cryomorphaceae bacterium]